MLFFTVSNQSCQAGFFLIGISTRNQNKWNIVIKLESNQLKLFYFFEFLVAIPFFTPTWQSYNKGWGIPRKTYQPEIYRYSIWSKIRFYFTPEYDVSSRPINGDLLSRSERMGYGPISGTIYVTDISRNVKYG